MLLMIMLTGPVEVRIRSERLRKYLIWVRRA